MSFRVPAPNTTGSGTGTANANANNDPQSSVAGNAKRRVTNKVMDTPPASPCPTSQTLQCNEDERGRRLHEDVSLVSPCLSFVQVVDTSLF
jgi:hypothetical protein